MITNKFLSIAVLVTLFLPQVISSQKKEEYLFNSGLAIKNTNLFRDSYLVQDTFEQLINSSTLGNPKPGDIVQFGDTGKTTWESLKPDSNGWFESRLLNDGYMLFIKESETNEIMILEGMGHNMVYVNGTPRAGNPYQYKEEYESWEPRFDYSLIPVELKRGKNEFLFNCSRGILKARMYKPDGKVILNWKDVTLPDVIAGKDIFLPASIVVINASTAELKKLKISACIAGGTIEVSDIPTLLPLSVRKVPFQLSCSSFDEAGKTSVHIKITGANQKVYDSITIPLKVVNSTETRKETFVSSIDGSVQYYAINPAGNRSYLQPAALFLSLHGANVEAINQAGSYFHKAWGHIVAPTNRRPFGFNWEDWGRLDALEVYNLVTKKFIIDKDRIYLTGHSMGGHGAWIIGANYPDKFAAIGPSAGWISFSTYRSRAASSESSAMKDMLKRATSQSNTFALAENYKQLGVYVIHGADDKTVSVDEARSMVKHLSGFHKDYYYHEQKGADHWWDISDEDGADCVDWKPMFDFFARRSRVGYDGLREINFITANPGLSASNCWITVEAQKEPLNFSSVNISVDPGKRRFYGTTKNIERLSVDISLLSGNSPLSVELDSQKISNINFQEDEKRIWLENKEGRWSHIEEPSKMLKNPLRYGTFKDAFKNKVVFVYGTRGTEEENKWALEKARYDAEKLWYQGNASIDIIADKDFNHELEPHRNVILYGNSNTNSAFNLLLAGCPVQVKEGSVLFGKNEYKGDDVCTMFIYPRQGSAIASVGVICASGFKGMKMLSRTPYFTPWVGMPDCIIYNSEILKKGDDAILVSGFFGNNWSIEKGEFEFGTK